MAEMISIPSEIKFKEMLSHTFPGFFLASSIFMLIDYLSPDNLTAWAIGSLTNLVTFAGFIIIIGTILGVIIDGIHHTFIEDDIFDNFETIHQLKKPIREQLKANCPSYSDNLSRHFFLSKIGEKGAYANTFETLLDEGYYRYSEFYSNIFVSLVIFSIISPFYIFEVLELPWKTSVLIGIASLLTACLCLTSSYTSYKMYLQAQCSVICGFITGASECTLNCKKMSADEKQKVIITLDNIKILLTDRVYTLINWNTLISLVIIVISLISIYALLKPTLSYTGMIIIISIIAFIMDLIGISLIKRYINDQEFNDKEAINFLDYIYKKSTELKNNKQDINNYINQLIKYECSRDENNKKEIIENSQKAQKYFDRLAGKYQIIKAKELSNNINKLINTKSDINEELDNLYKRLIEINELCKNVKEFTDHIEKSDKEKEKENKVNKINNYWNNLNNSNLPDKAIEIKDKFTNKELKDLINNSKKNDDIMGILSKSSFSALFSFIIGLFVFLIVSLLAYTPINLNVETSSIIFNDNIANNTTLENSVETISLTNLGRELNSVSLSINGIASNWLEICYINDRGDLVNNSPIDNIASGETKFVQIKLNSSAMDTKNISQGSYLGSIDVKYYDRLKSIPLIINLNK